MCPSRTRAHELETESEAALSRCNTVALGIFAASRMTMASMAKWRFFDLNGKATGQLVLVQLKATDESDLRKALRFDLATL